MTAIKKLIDGNGNQYFPQTHTKAVVDDNGYTAESRLAAMQDEINDLQEGVVVVGEGMTPVPSDLTPTKNSSNWVTSGGVYNGVPSNTNSSGSFDLAISDETGNILAMFKDGDLVLKNLNSKDLLLKIDNCTIGDFFIADDSGNILVAFENGNIKTKNFDSTKNNKEIKILCIGNSWTGDFLNYTGAIIDEVLDGNAKIHLGFAYIGGASLQDHYNNLVNNGSYTFYEWRTGSTYWTKETKNINSILVLDSWDVVITQQVSLQAQTYSSYQPYLNNMLDLISERVTKTVKFGWNLVRERVDTPNVFEDISEAAQNLLKETLIQFILPCGTALQNARTTSLDNLGDGGHLTYDGSHLQEGIPCLIEAYAASMTFLDLFGFGYKGINGSSFRPTQSWIDAHGMNGQSNGSSVGVTDANVILAKKCATIAVNNPFVITDCSTL